MVTHAGASVEREREIESFLEEKNMQATAGRMHPYSPWPLLQLYFARTPKSRWTSSMTLGEKAMLYLFLKHYSFYPINNLLRIYML